MTDRCTERIAERVDARRALRATPARRTLMSGQWHADDSLHRTELVPCAASAAGVA